MYPDFAKDQLTTDRPANKLDGMMWCCVSKQASKEGGEQGSSEPSLITKPFAHRSGRSFRQFDPSLCITRVCLSVGTATRLANPEGQH